jgi:serine/threonine protein kinase
MLRISNGQTIANYKVEAFLGRGAFTQVFLVTDTNGDHWAMKLGDDSGGGKNLPRFGEVTVTRDPRAVSPDETPAEAMFIDAKNGATAEILDAAEVDELLREEARLLELADGFGTPKLKEVVDVNGRPALVMQHITGLTLRERIRSMEGVKLGWMSEVCKIVLALHSKGWECHGDLKPENILISENGEVYIIDPVAKSTRNDRIVTTPWYNPFLLWSSKGDAQSVAIMLYELLIGGLPFDSVPWRFAGTDLSLHDADEVEMSRSMFLSYPPMRGINVLTPRHIEAIFHRTMCEDAYDLADLSAELEEFLIKH